MAISDLSISDSSTEDELTLSWSSVSGADGYYVYRAQSSGSSKSDYTQIANISTTGYTDTGLEDGEKYYYVVTSYSGGLVGKTIHRYKAGEGTGSTVSDSVGTEDATNNGGWVSGTYVGSNAVDLQNSGMDLTTLGNFGSNLDTEWAIAVTVKNVSSSGRIVFGDSSTSSGGSSGAGTRLNLHFDSNQAPVFNIVDLDGNKLTIESSAGIDTNKHRLVFNKTGNQASDLEIWQDNTNVSVTVQNDQSFSNVKDFDLQPVVVGYKQFNGGYASGYKDYIVDDLRICDSSLNSTEIDTDYQNQPWT